MLKMHIFLDFNTLREYSCVKGQNPKITRKGLYKMKKLLSILLSLSLMFGLTACGSNSGDIKEPSSVSSKSKNSNIANEIETSDEPVEEQVPEVIIEETVLLDEEGVKITAKALEIDGFWGADLKLLIENNSEKDLTVQARNSSVNGYMVETMMSTDVVAGKKANDTLAFSSSDLEACGIQTIADMEFAFHIFDAEWETYLDSEQIQVRTSAAEDYTYNYDDSGTPVYEGNGIKIVAKGISDDDSIFGPGLLLYMYSSADMPLTIQARDVSVNGFMVDPIFSEDMMPGKHANTAITFMSSDLEENDITEITEIEVSFHVFSLDDWETVVDTEKIKLTF